MTQANKANRALQLFAALRQSIDNEVNAKKLNALSDVNNVNNNDYNKLLSRKQSCNNNKSNGHNSINQAHNLPSPSVLAQLTNTKLTTNSKCVLQHSHYLSSSLQPTKKALHQNDKMFYQQKWQEVKLINLQLTQRVADAQKQIKQLQKENNMLSQKLQVCTTQLQQQKSHCVQDQQSQWQKQLSLLQRQKKELSKRLYLTQCQLNKTKHQLQQHKANVEINNSNKNNKNSNSNSKSIKEENCNNNKNGNTTKTIMTKANEQTTSQLLLAIGEKSNDVKTLQMCITNLKEQLTHLSQQFNYLLNVQLDAALRNTSNADQLAIRSTSQSVQGQYKDKDVHYVNEEVKKLFKVLRGALQIQVQERQKERMRANELLYRLQSKLASLEE